MNRPCILHPLMLCIYATCWCVVFSSPVQSAEPPQTVEEAYQKLIKVFGEPKDPARLTRVTIDEEIETRPKDDSSKVIVINKGKQYYTNPVIEGDSIVYYVNEVLERNVFNETNEGQRKLNRRVERTMSIRHKITLFAPGFWIVEQRLDNHSLPKYSGLTSSAGTVKWLDDGVEFQLAGSDAMYQPDGSTKPVAYTSSERYSLQGDQVVQEGNVQMYEAATSPDGLKLLVPDFSNPIGKPVKFKRVSESRN